jgi:hypothetical protein
MVMNKTGLRGDPTEPKLDEILDKISSSALNLGTALPRLLDWSVRSGSPIVAGGMGLYLFLVCVESYYRALPTVNGVAQASARSLEESLESGEVTFAPVETVEVRPAFIPKPGIEDGARLSNIGQANGLELTLCFLFAMFIATMQTSLQRGKTPEEAKADYDAVAHHVIAEEPPKNRINVVGLAHDDYKKSGTAPRTRNGLLIGLSYTIDGSAALKAFGATALSGGLAPFGLAVFWSLASVFGPELCLGWMRDRLNEQRQRKAAAATEPQPKPHPQR